MSSNRPRRRRNKFFITGAKAVLAVPTAEPNFSKTSVPPDFSTSDFAARSGSEIWVTALNSDVPTETKFAKVANDRCVASVADVRSPDGCTFAKLPQNTLLNVDPRKNTA